MPHACPFLLHRWASLHSNRKLTSSCLYFWPCLLSGRAYVSHGIHIRTIQNGLLQEEMHMRRYTFFASLNAWNFSKTASAFWSFISSRPLDRRHTILHFHFAVISSSRPLNHSYRRSGTVNIENKINLTSDSCWVIVTNAGCQFKSILFSLTWFIPFLLKCTHRDKPVHYFPHRETSRIPCCCSFWFIPAILVVVVRFVFGVEEYTTSIPYHQILRFFLSASVQSVQVCLLSCK